MPGGRPSKINTVVATRTTEDGTVEQITAADRIVQCIRMGGYIETAAATAAVSKVSVYEWLKVGATANDRHHRQGVPLAKLTAHERRCMEFANAVAEAEALAEMDDVATLAELAGPGRTRTTTTMKRDGSGDVLEHTTRTEELDPDARVLMWRLERRHPDRWGRRRLEVSGPDGDAIPVEARVAGILAAARAYHAAPTAGGGARAIETTADEAGGLAVDAPDPG